MAIGIGHGKTAVNTSAGNQVFSATMVGDPGATPKLLLAWLVRSETDDVVQADGYLSHGVTDGSRTFCDDCSTEDGVASSSSRRALTNGAATLTSIIRTRRASNTADVTNSDVQLRFVSFGSGQVTLNVTVPPPAGYYLIFVLIGGSDFTCILDDSIGTVNVGAHLDRTGLGVPAEAAIVYLPRRNIGAAVGAASVNVGFWSASAHAGRAFFSSSWPNGENPPAPQECVRNDANGGSIDGSGDMLCTLSQHAQGFTITNSGSTSIGNEKFVVAMSFAKKRVAWVGFLETPTELGAYAWEEPRVRPDLALALLNRRQTLNDGDGSGSADSGVAGWGVWSTSTECALAISLENGTSPTVAKMHVASRFLSIPRTNGQLTGDPSDPQPGDAILATATEGARGLDFFFTRTSSDARQIPMLVIGDEQTLTPNPVAIGVAEPSVGVLQFQTPSPVLINVSEPNPFLGFIRPTPVVIGLSLPTVALDLPLPATPGIEASPPPPLADYYAQALFDLLPRGLAWTRDPASVLGRLLRAFAEELARFEFRVRDLVRESDVRQTHELLQEWEEWLRTREHCPELGATEEERRFALQLRLATPGGQNAYHYAQVAQLLGYEIEVEDFEEVQEFRVGISTVGEALWNGEWVFVVIVHAPTISPIFFRAGLSSAGEPLATSSSERLTCELDRIKPAHVFFLYQFDKPYTGYSPWHLIGPSPVVVRLVVPIPLRT